MVGPNERGSSARDWIVDAIMTRVWLVALSLILLGIVGLLASHTFSLADAPRAALQELSSVLIATGLVTTVYELYVARHFSSLMESDRKTLLDVLISDREHQERIGVRRVYENRDRIPWGHLIEKAQEEIAILDTTISYWREMSEFERLFKQAAERVSIRILTLDPDSAFAGHRAKVVARVPEQFPREIRYHRDEFIEFARTLPEDSARRIEIKQYQFMPCLALMRVDNTLIVNFHLHGPRSRSHLHFELDKSTAGAKPYWDHFESVWEQSQTYYTGEQVPSERE